MKPLSREGFTFVELVITLLIIGIIAGLGIPIFLNIGIQAKINQERAMIGNLTVAINNEHLRRVVNHITPEWPDDNPFLYLNPTPPHIIISTTQPPDGIHWLLFKETTCKYWVITCPHWNGTTEGTVWYYAYDNSIYGISPPQGRRPGMIYTNQYYDLGHH